MLAGRRILWLLHIDDLHSNGLSTDGCRIDTWIESSLQAMISRKKEEQLREAKARVLSVGVFCKLEELERRESARNDGALEGRPLGLSRRSQGGGT